LQTLSSSQTTTIGGGTARAVSVDARSKGLEAQLQLFPARGLSIDFFYALLDAKARAGQTVPDFNNNPVQIGGNRLPQAPKRSFTVGLSYRTDVGEDTKLRFNTNFNYEGVVCYTIENTSCNYEVLRKASIQRNWDASLGITHKRVDLSLFVRNILDRQAANRVLAGPTSAMYHPFEAFGLRKQFWGGLIQRPRTFGATLRYNFGGQP
jgi:outer membrane receptor protein involved in Fe transport